MACTITYKGKEYSEAEWATYVRGHLDEVVSLPGEKGRPAPDPVPYPQLVAESTPALPITAPAVAATTQLVADWSTLNTDERARLMALPETELADQLRTTFEPLLTSLANTDPASYALTRLTREREDGRAAGRIVTESDGVRAELDPDVLAEAVARLKNNGDYVPVEVAARLADLEEAFGEGSLRAELKKLPATELQDRLAALWEPVLQDIAATAPESSKIMKALTRKRTDGPFKGIRGGLPLFDVETGRIDPLALQAMVAEIKRGRASGGSETTARLRHLIWQGADVTAPDALAAYRSLASRPEGGAVKALTQLVWKGENQTLPDAANAYRILRTGSGVLIGANGEKSFIAKGSDSPDIQQANEAFEEGGWWSRLLTSRALMNPLTPEAWSRLVSTGEGSNIRRIFGEIKDRWQARSDEAKLRMGEVLAEANRAFDGLTMYGMRGPGEGLQRIKFDGWINGEKGEIEADIDTAFDLVQTIWTQLSYTRQLGVSEEGLSSAIADVDASGNLIKTRSVRGQDGVTVQEEYGYVFEDEDSKKPQTWVVTREQYEELRQTLQNNYPQLFEVASRFYDDPVIYHYVSGVYETVFEQKFPKVNEYYPTQSYSTESDAIDKDGRLVALEENRILQERRTPPGKVRGMSALRRMSQQMRVQGDFIANTPIRVNLTNWIKQNREAYDALPKPVTDYARDLEQDLKSPGYRFRNEQKAMQHTWKGVDIGLVAWLRRYSRATFALRLVSPWIQASSYVGNFGVGVIEDKYLAQSAGTLFKLTLDSYRLGKDSARGDRFGEFAEVPYIEEMIKNPYMKDLVWRVIGQTENYIGNPTVEDLKKAPDTAGLALARRWVNSLGQVTSKPMKSADRAVFIAIHESAKAMVQDKILKGELIDTDGNLITDINSDFAMQTVADLTRQQASLTNSFSGTANAAGLSRQRNLGGIIFGLYGAQQMKLASTVISSVADWIHLRHRLRMGDPTVTPEMVAMKARSAAITGTSLILVNSAVVALLQALFRTLTGGEQEEEFATAFAFDVFRGAAGSLPGLPSSVITTFTTFIDPQGYQEDVIAFPPAEALNTFFTGVVASGRYFNAEDDKEAERALDTMLWGISAGGSKLIGVSSTVPSILLKLSKAEKVSESDWQVDSED